MQTKIFQRTIENFQCEHCGRSVKGDGYTNHCPFCLWSKHVDVNPGDRLSDCGGMMKPVGLIKKGEQFVIIHQCEVCGHKKNNRVCTDDDFDVVVGL